MPASFAKHASSPACQPSPAQPSPPPPQGARRSALQLQNKALVAGDWTPWKERVGYGLQLGIRDCVVLPCGPCPLSQILNTISEASTDRLRPTWERIQRFQTDSSHLVSSRLSSKVIAIVAPYPYGTAIAATVRSRNTTSTGDAARPLRGARSQERGTNPETAWVLNFYRLLLSRSASSLLPLLTRPNFGSAPRPRPRPRPSVNSITSPKSPTCISRCDVASPSDPFVP